MKKLSTLLSLIIGVLGEGVKGVKINEENHWKIGKIIGMS